MITYMYIAPGQGHADSPQGDKVLMLTEMSYHFIHLLQVSKKSLTLYNFFHELIHVYSPGAEADRPQGTKFRCQQKGALSFYSFAASFKEISLKSDFAQFFS